MADQTDQSELTDLQVLIGDATELTLAKPEESGSEDTRCADLRTLPAARIPAVVSTPGPPEG